jgi:translation initiation factor 2B subunit (eIF-2B alpha/beta/delta family)
VFHFAPGSKMVSDQGDSTMHIGTSNFARMITATLAATLLCGALFAAGDDKAASKTGKKNQRRLPAYYAQVISADQREQIYKIQEKFAPQIKELQDKLQAVRAQRDSALRAVLTPEQQKKLDALVAAAKEKRKQAKAAESAATQ